MSRFRFSISVWKLETLLDIHCFSSESLLLEPGFGGGGEAESGCWWKDLWFRFGSDGGARGGGGVANTGLPYGCWFDRRP